MTGSASAYRASIQTYGHGEADGKPQFLLVGLFGNSQPVKQTALKNKSKNSELSTPSKKASNATQVAVVFRF